MMPETKAELKRLEEKITSQDRRLTDHKSDVNDVVGGIATTLKGIEKAVTVIAKVEANQENLQRTIDASTIVNQQGIQRCHDRIDKQHELYIALIEKRNEDRVKDAEDTAAMSTDIKNLKRGLYGTLAIFATAVVAFIFK